MTIVKQIRKLVLYKIFKLNTYGVRILVLNRDKEEVLLIKHYYDNFWVMPGGGIKKNEISSTAASRELLEETSLINKDDMILLGKYKNITGGKKDFVFVYICENFSKSLKNKTLIDKLEIKDCKWFKLNNLPHISKATRNRIEECVSGNFSEKTRDW